jgi:signal peptidase II
MEETRKSTNARFVAWAFVALVVVIADQVTKWAIIEWVALYEKIPLNSFINLTHQRNTGAAFSFLATGAAFSFLADAGGWQRWFFVTLASIVSLVITIWLWRIRKEGQVVLAAGLALVLGGAIGNLIDRIMLGYVTDFIQVWFGSWAFPSFNVADASISVGAALLIIDALFFSGKDEANSS